MEKVVLIGNSDIVLYNFRFELIERLIKEKYEVHLIAPYGPRIEILKKIGCIYHSVKISRHGKNIVKDFLLYKSFEKLFRDINPNYIFGYTIKPNIYGALAAKKFKIPFIVNITGLGTAVENESFLQKFVLNLYRFAFKNVQTIFFQNQDNMNFFKENNIYPKKHKLLPGSGVNLKKYKLLPYPNDNTVHFAFISRIMKEKGIDNYIESAKFIKSKYPNTVFHVCGFCEEDYSQQLKQLEKEGIIIYHGLILDVVSFLEKIHCVIHPTYYPEGLSNALLEACACGRPIITTNRSGCKEVIVDNFNGYIVNKNDSSDLTNKIEKFMSLSNSQKKDFGINGHNYVKTRFDREIVISRYLKEIKSKN